VENINEVKQAYQEYKERMSKLHSLLLLDDKAVRLKQIEQDLSDPNVWNDREKAQNLNKEAASLRRLIDAWASANSKINDGLGLCELIELESDMSMLPDAIKEAVDVGKLVADMEFRRMLGGEFDHLGAILTINAGAGGTDAQDWAQMLFRMYTRWMERKGYKFEVVDYQDGEEAGIKSATILVNGEYAYGYLKAEIGIHRVVRISPFDSNARRHTSFAAVYTSPQIDDDINVEINEVDLKIDTYRAGGAGGQHVNRTESAVRITHMPTGIVVQCQNDRSQHKNKATALKVLKARLYERELELKREKTDKANAEKKKIEWGSQIRSYVLHPYQMVKDHRTDHEEGNVNAVLDGELDSFMVEYLMDSGGAK